MMKLSQAFQKIFSYIDTDKDAGFKPGFDQIKKKRENFYLGPELDATRERQRTGAADQDRTILRVACHICKQFMFQEKKSFIVPGDSFRYIHFEQSFYPRFCLVYSLFNDVKLYVVESFSD